MRTLISNNSFQRKKQKYLIRLSVIISYIGIMYFKTKNGRDSSQKRSNLIQIMVLKKVLLIND